MYKYLKNGHYHAVPARDLSDAEWQRFTANLSAPEVALVVTLYEFQPGELPPRVITVVQPSPPVDPAPEPEPVIEPEPTEPEVPNPEPTPEPSEPEPEPTPPEPEQQATVVGKTKKVSN